MMKGTVLWVMGNWIPFAVVMSLFSGVQAAVLFTPKSDTGARKWLTMWYQLWLNLVCSFAGWTAIHLMYARYAGKDTRLDTGLLFIFLTAMLGITGHLAELVHGGVKLLQFRLQKS